MVTFTRSCILILLIVSASLAQAEHTDSCRACCKEVYGVCKEGHLARCDARYNECMKRCLQKDILKDNGTTPKTEQPPTTIIPEIPPNREKLEDLKKR